MQKGGSEETLSLKNMNLVPTSNAAASVSSSKRHSNMEKVELTSLQRAEYWPIVEDWGGRGTSFTSKEMGDLIWEA